MSAIITEKKESRFPMLSYKVLNKKGKKDRGVYVFLNFNEVSHFFECRNPDVPEIVDPDGGMAFATTVIMNNGSRIYVERKFLDFAKDMMFGKD